VSKKNNTSSGLIIGSFWKCIIKTTLAILFIGSLQVEAAHISGGDITYLCTGGNNYDVTLNLYRDCTGAPMDPQDINFVSDCGDQFSFLNVPISSSSEVSQLCPAQLLNSTCNGGTLPGIEIYQYTVSVALPPCDSWTMSWDICCRNTSLNVVGTSGIYIEATLNNATAPCNSSPAFTDQTIPYVCLGQPVSYGFSVTEPDGNIVEYSLISARLAAPGPFNVNYVVPNSGPVPYPGLVIDTVTGVVKFTPTAIGTIIVVVQIDEYNSNGDLIGTIIKDMIFVVIVCTNQVPIDQGISNLVGLASANGFYEVDICEGGYFCFDVEFIDADAGDILTITSTVTALLPGATLTVSGTNPATATFCWTALAGYGTVTIPLVAEDDACPIVGVAQTAITMTVTDPISNVDPGLDSSLNICEDHLPFLLYSNLGGSPQSGGTWTDPNNVAFPGAFFPATDLAGVYTYTVPGAAPCWEAQSATVTIMMNPLVDAGTDGNIIVSSSDPAFDLFAILGGTPDGVGTWTDPNNVAFSGTFDPATDPAGVYTYTVAGTPPCPDQSATVTITMDPSILPIELALFEANVSEDQSVKVQWVTASENNNDHFTVEYSVDGVDWKVITIIAGAGNSTSLISYEFIHPDPVLGKAYYRLKQTDHNGTYTYSDIRSVTISGTGTFSGTASLEIFPNPSARSITCNIVVLTGGKYRLAIYDLSARMLLYRDLELTAGAHSLNDDISSLSNGTYTIVLSDEQNDHIVTKLLMINK